MLAVVVRGGFDHLGYYRTLGVNETADAATLKKAWHTLSVEWHPDKNPHNPELAQKKFIEIKEVYDLLRDADKRAEYDARNRAMEKEIENAAQTFVDVVMYQASCVLFSCSIHALALVGYAAKGVWRRCVRWVRRRTTWDASPPPQPSLTTAEMFAGSWERYVANAEEHFGEVDPTYNPMREDPEFDYGKEDEEEEEEEEEHHGTTMDAVVVPGFWHFIFAAVLYNLKWGFGFIFIISHWSQNGLTSIFLYRVVPAVLLCFILGRESFAGVRMVQTRLVALGVVVPAPAWRVHAARLIDAVLSILPLPSVCWLANLVLRFCGCSKTCASLGERLMGIRPAHWRAAAWKRKAW